MPPLGQLRHRLFDVEVSFWLKPVAKSLVSCNNAEVVECPGRIPCWSADGGRWLLAEESKRVSLTFSTGQRSEIGR